jgi:hypothetical protein
MAELIRWVDYNLETGNNDGTTEADAFRGVDALNYAILNMDTYAKQCTTNSHVLRIIVKGVGKSSTSANMEKLGATYLTSNTYYVQIEVDEREKNLGFFDSDKFYLDMHDGSGDNLFLVQDTPQNLRFKNFQFLVSCWGAFQIWSGSGINVHYQFENCIFDNTDSPRFSVCMSARGFYNILSIVTFINCIFINWNIGYEDTHGSINFMYLSPNPRFLFYNCQFHNVSMIFYDDFYTSYDMDVLYINCLFDNVLKLQHSETYTYVTEEAECSNNSSSSLVIPSIGTSYTNQTFLFEDSENNKYKILGGDSGAKEKGLDNSGAGYTEDIRGFQRVEPWDIGAFQITLKNKSALNGLFSAERLIL